MTANVLLFAGLRELIGSDVVEVELADEATYSQLVATLAARYPSGAALLQASRVAAAGEFVSPESAVHPTIEIAIIPPVSGG